MSKEEQAPQQFSFKGRMFAVSLVLILPCLLIVARLYELQIKKYDHYSTLVNKQQKRFIITPPVRGQIYSSDGLVLAGNRAHFDLTIHPSQMRTGYSRRVTRDAILKTTTDLEENILKRKSILPNARKLDLLLQRDMAQPIVLFKDLTDEELARCAEMTPQPKGISIVPRIERDYPMPGVATHILGITEWKQRPLPNRKTYSYKEISSQSGLEGRFNSELSGKTGIKVVLNNPSGFIFDELPDSIDKVDGFDLILTIDSQAQAAADAALAEAEMDYGTRDIPLDSRTQRPAVFGALVAMDIHTGAVLAMASSPSFDLATLTPAQHAEMRADTRINRLFNRALKGQYMPGSIIKPLVALTALEKGCLNAASPYNCTGYYAIGDSRISCARRYGHGELALQEAIAVSCNPFFIHAGIICTIDSLKEMYEAAGIGEETGFELGNSKGLLPERATLEKRMHRKWTRTDTAFASIGQGSILVTPLQAACYTAALANGGTLWRPYITQRFIGKNGVVISETTPYKRRTLPVTQEHLKLVQESMEMAVNAPNASAAAMRHSPVPVAAKTGTAEVTSAKENKAKNTWIICYGPLPNPTFAVACVLENGASGGKTTAPVVVHFLNKWLGELSPEQ
ncbi:MAG: hypothetical protein IKP00_07350 [Victivallales bacterium]|nr:hypothetical protein [Victivallales bacterium]